MPRECCTYLVSGIPDRLKRFFKALQNICKREEFHINLSLSQAFHSQDLLKKTEGDKIWNAERKPVLQKMPGEELAFQIFISPPHSMRQSAFQMNTWNFHD